MTEEQEKELITTAKGLPADRVVQFEQQIKGFFIEEKVPYNDDTLRAARAMTSIIHAGLPPIYGQFTSATVLFLSRLIDENKTGLITSPIQPKK